MSTRHLVDFELAATLDQLPEFSLSAESLIPYREGMRATALAVPLPQGDAIRRTETFIPGVDGDPEVRVLVFEPDAATEVERPALLHIHGGGYVMGLADMSDARCRAYATALDCVVVSVDYRLAPETPFPGPVNDCFAGLVWLIDQAASLNIDRARIAVAGESAGGGLSAAVALMARDRGIDLVYQALVYPMIDDRVGKDVGLNPHTGEFLWTRKSNQFGWNAYLEGKAGGEDVPAYAAPARADNFGELAPAYIGTGSLDLFLEEDVDYAMRLMRAGVSVDLHVYPGAYHGFESNPQAELSAAMRGDVIRGLRRAFRSRS